MLSFLRVRMQICIVRFFVVSEMMESSVVPYLIVAFFTVVWLIWFILCPIEHEKCEEHLQEVKKDIEEKLAIVRHFNQIEEGFYSSHPEAVENATSLLNIEFREGNFEGNRDYLNILINKCTMMKVPGLSDCLVTISVAVHFCGDAIKRDNELLKSLYRLLLQYKDRDLRDLDLQVIHAGHSLLVIADLLSTTELNDENIGYWLNNTNLIRLNYLEF